MARLNETSTFTHGELEDFLETHYEVVVALEQLEESETNELLNKYLSENGTGGKYMLAHFITEDFQREHANTEFDGNFIDVIEDFILNKINRLS